MLTEGGRCTAACAAVARMMEEMIKDIVSRSISYSELVLYVGKSFSNDVSAILMSSGCPSKRALGLLGNTTNTRRFRCSKVCMGSSKPLRPLQSLISIL